MSDVQFFHQEEGRYDRHDLIAWWDQKRVASARVIVVGAGALGNEVLKLMALIGIGQITLIDFDRISPSNLSRMVLFRQEDVGKSKAQMAAQRLKEINPAVKVEAVEGDLRFCLGLGDLRRADAVLGCLDSVNARWALNRKCMQAGVGWIDGAISDFHGMVARYSPHEGACYECTFTPRTYERFNRRYSCPFGLLAEDAEEKVPTTAVTTSVIAAFQVQQMLLDLHHLPQGLQPGERLTLYLQPFHMVKDLLPANPECLAHFTYPADLPVIPAAPNTPLTEIFEQVGRTLPGSFSLQLPYDFVTAFSCESCAACQPVNRPKERVRQAEAACPTCGGMRQPEIVQSIEAGSYLVHLTIEQLGIPSHDILVFAQGEHKRYFQLIDPLERSY